MPRLGGSIVRRYAKKSATIGKIAPRKFATEFKTAATIFSTTTGGSTGTGTEVPYWSEVHGGGGVQRVGARSICSSARDGASRSCTTMVRTLFTTTRLLK